MSLRFAWPRGSAVGAALLAGALYPLGFAPFERPALTLFALAGLFAVWQSADARAAAWRGYAFGLGQFGVGVSWVYISIHDYGGADTGLAGLLTALLAAFLAIYPALAGYLTARLFSPGSAQRLLLGGPAVWVWVEWLRGWLFTGFPWLQLGYSQVGAPLGRWASYAGVYGVGWLAAWVAAALAAFVLLNGAARRVWPALAALVCLVSLYKSPSHWTQSVGERLPVALLQGNISQDLKFQAEQRWQTLETYMGLTWSAWPTAKVVVWPETAVPAFYESLSDSFFAKLQTAAIEQGSDVLVGVPVGKIDGQYYNGLVSIGANPGIYRKQHLVPFGEFLPLKPVLGFILELVQIPLSDFSAGSADQPLLRAGGQPLAATICYEDTFGNEFRHAAGQGAYLVNVSNDAWFGDSIAPHQHLQMARMRALESQRYLLRATNTGITAVVAPDGQIIKQLPLFQTAALHAEIQPLQGLTPYVRYGDTPVITLLCVLLLWVGWRVYKDAVTDPSDILGDRHA